MLMTYSPHDLPHLRQVVDPALSGLPTLQLRSTVDSALGEGTADAMETDLEGVFDGFGRALSSAAKSVGHFAQQQGPGLAQIGGGLLQGAMAGSAGGIPGIIAGAAAGGVGAGLSRYGSGTARQIGNTLTGVTRAVGQFTPMGQAGGALGSVVGGLGGMAAGRGGRAGGGGAMGQLAGMLGSPQTAGALAGLFGGGSAVGQLSAALGNPAIQQALAALRLGQLGRSAIPVGPRRQPVPTAAFPQLLGHLAQQAAAEAVGGADEAESLAFMADGAGGFAGDPANPVDRAAMLWDLLNAATAEHVVETIGFESAQNVGQEAYEDESEHADAEAADYYDQLDLAELAEMEYALETEPHHGW